MFKFRFRRLSNPRSIAKAVKQIVLDEEHYDQHLWMSRAFFYDVRDDIATGTELRNIANQNVCGTTACVAGNVVILTIGAKDKYDYPRDKVVFANGESEDVLDYAQVKLGLTYRQASWLFESYRTREEVLAALDLLEKGKSIDGLLTFW